MSKIISFLICFFCVFTVSAQINTIPKNTFLGKWIAIDTGIYVTTTAIQLLYKNDNKWQVSNWEHERMTFIDTAINNTKKIFTAWGEMVSFLRAYLIDGGEEMTYYANFCIYKMELLDTNTLRLSQSKVFKVVSENFPVHEKVTTAMKEGFTKNNKFERVIILRRLK